jgi:hypothetical protein
MSAYGLLRIAHGYWRWAVLAAALVVLVRAMIGVMRRRAWTPADDRASRIFGRVLDVQILIGLVLYFGFSPFWPALYRTFSETMQSDVARFFGIEHQVAMVLAAVAAQVGRSRASRALEPLRRHRTMLVAMLVFFALTLWAVPWPWRIVGRPLFRTEL